MREVHPVIHPYDSCPRCGQVFGSTDRCFRICEGIVYCSRCDEWLPHAKSTGTYIMLEADEVFAPCDQ